MYYSPNFTTSEKLIKQDHAVSVLRAYENEGFPYIRQKNADFFSCADMSILEIQISLALEDRGGFLRKDLINITFNFNGKLKTTHSHLYS